ncbi:MAG: DUF5329 family protein [Mariprofundaceae bacterium]|nr:DUF5329 family protein [Mariprofundaceae bacterium]
MTKISFMLFMTYCLYAPLAYADTKQEIDHLLDFVANTTCLYERNGTQHTGTEAKKHIMKKYNYYQDDIKTAEDFIAYSATKSMLSGKKYKIHCANKAEETSHAWLMQELHHFRQAKQTATP